MKKFKSTLEGNWVELLPVQLTNSEKMVLLKGEKQEVKVLRDKIKTEKIGDVDSELVESLNIFYNSVKPELKENDLYHLISIDLLGEGSSYKGILNCRINGDHKQIRF
jgi:hypothetical protein